MEVEQVLAGGGKENASNVLRPSVILHTQQVGGPAQVGLLVHFGMAAKDDVEAASAGAALQHISRPSSSFFSMAVAATRFTSSTLRWSMSIPTDLLSRLAPLRQPSSVGRQE